MYVIFPADELILLTYGAAIPRLPPRPTLDNLREPLVPIGVRPTPSSHQHHLHQQHLNETQNRRQSVSYSSNLNLISGRDPRSGVAFTTSSSTNITSSTAALHRDELYDSTQYLNDTRQSREASPGLYIDTASSSSPKQSLGDKSKGNKKQRPRLHLPLGRLVRPHSHETAPESVRLREDQDIRVTNPTFTRDNLRQRNFDAFFESGEPVYALEKREKPTPTPDPDLPPLPTPGQRPNSSLGFFRRATTPSKSIAPPSKSGGGGGSTLKLNEVSQKESPKTHRSIFGWRGGAAPRASTNMATSGGTILKELTHPSLNETLKTHNSVTFKLVKTVSDFTETLAQIYEQHAEALQLLVSNFRKKNGELRKERPACQSSLFYAWEVFLQEIEADSQATTDVASALSRQVSRPLLERSFHRKVQSRKVFTHRESFDTIIAKTEEKLSKCRLDYKQCYITHRQSPTQHSLNAYIDSHNAYVQQLHATNAMLEAYHCETVPQLLQELEDIYTDLCNIVADAVLQGAEAIGSKASQQSKRYDGLIQNCKTVSGPQDLGNLVRSLALPPNSQRVPKKAFAPPQPVAVADGDPNMPAYDETGPPNFKNELVTERGSSLQVRPSLDALSRESQELESQIRQLQESVDALVRTQVRGLDSQLYNKANEIQEDISMKKFDLRAKQLHWAAVRAQKELFLSKIDPGSPRAERKMSTSSSSSMKTKWMKAFRSLKPANEKKNGAGANAQGRTVDSENHNLLEYTYKKITPCDVCGQVLRGHTRQGLRCRICKVNAHADCASQLPPKCQVKQSKLLRRQKSTSEIENRDVEDEKAARPTAPSTAFSSRLVAIKAVNALETPDVDQTYQVLKQAGELSSVATASNKLEKPISSITSTSNLISNNNGVSVANPHMIDIPIVNVPDYPDQTPRRGPPLKPAGPNLQRHGLAAPTPDISSSSDYRGYPNPAIAGGGGGVGGYSTNYSATTGVDTGTRRRLFAGFRPMSGFGLLRMRSSQNRSISLPETPHSPRRQKLNLRMKSLSLDSPESTELHGQMRGRRYPGGPSSSMHQGGGSGGHLEHSTPPSSNSRLHSPSSPSHQRKLLYANRSLKTGSVDLPDDIEKSLSSASTSPCPSPKPYRLLPTNLYVVLYNFKSRHPDELDLKAGYKVTVQDRTDSDWWQGKCLGRLGYFPSKYVTKLAAGEKPLQVTHNLQVPDGERGVNTLTLLRDQIVIQVAEEVSGMVLVRSAENRQGLCPAKYLQEV